MAKGNEIGCRSLFGKPKISTVRVIRFNFPNEKIGFFRPFERCRGHARAFLKEYLQFLKIAYGSAAELETQLIITKEIKILDSNSFEVLMSDLNEVQKMLNGLIISLKRLKPST